MEPKKKTKAAPASAATRSAPTFLTAGPYLHAERLYEALGAEGAFLTVRGADGRANPMTIGWATLGRIWGLPLMTVLVRGSRFTFGLLERARTFSVSVAGPGELRDALKLCGSQSGRDVDKFAACHLTPAAGRLEDVAVVGEASWFWECRVVHQNDVLPLELAPSIVERFYPKGDFHRIYYGEVLHAYRREA